MITALDQVAPAAGTAEPAPPGERAPRRGARIAAAALLAGLVAGVIALAALQGANAGGNRVRDSSVVVTALDLDYPTEWSETELSDADHAAGLLSRADHTDTGATFLLRTVVGRLEVDFDIAELASAAERELAANVDDFRVVDRDTMTIASLEILRIVYTQHEEEAAFETLLVVAPLPNQTVYATLRSPVDHFGRVGPDGLRFAVAAVEAVAARGQ